MKSTVGGNKMSAHASGDSREFLRRPGIVREHLDRIRSLAQRARQPQRGPRTAHPPQIEPNHLLNGFLGARSVSRTGTAPKPSSRRMPFTK